MKNSWTSNPVVRGSNPLGRATNPQESATRGDIGEHGETAPCVSVATPELHSELVTPSALAEALRDLLEFSRRVCNGGDCSRHGACVSTQDTIARAEALLARYDAQQRPERDGETGGAP